MISLASVSIFRTNAFSLLFNTSGGGGNIFCGCFIIEIVFDEVSTSGLIACGTSFRGSVVVFLDAGFGVVDGFAVVVDFLDGDVFGTVDWVICFTHSRKVISSKAKSFPQPPGALSIITNNNVEVEAGVVK